MRNLFSTKQQPSHLLKIIDTLLLLLLSNIFAYTQNLDFCDMATSTAFYQGGGCEIVDPSEVLYVNIYMHVITDDNGEGGLTNEEVGLVFDKLEEIFLPIDIFFVWCGDINTIKSNNYFYAPNMSILDGVFDSSYGHENGIDIFLAPEIHAVNGGRANGIAGYSEGASSELVIAGVPRVVPTNLPLALTPVIAHEVGHVLGLFHTHESGAHGVDDGTDCENTGDLCCMTPLDPNVNNAAGALCEYLGGGGFDPDMGNIMSYTPPRCMDGFKEDQIEKMRNNIVCIEHLNKTLTEPPAAPCSCSSELIIINEDTEYTENRSIGNYIYIQSGATLTVNNATLFFAEHSGVRVFGGGKLLLKNGAILTKCILGNNWKGVEVDGRIDFFGTEYEGGELEILEGSLIEYAQTGIKSFKGFDDPFLGPFVPVGTGGARITIDNSTLENCEIALLLGISNNADDYNINESHIRYCPVGIKLMQAGMSVQYTEFEDCDAAVIMESIFPNVQAIDIGNNTFEHYNCAMYAGSISSLDNLFIHDNIIEDGETGIFIDGQANFIIRENRIFDNESGVAIHSTGDYQFNEIRGNTFSENAEGCNVQFRTSSLFTANCFYNSGVADVALINGSDPNPTSIQDAQGSVTQSAGNCFSESKFQFATDSGPDNRIESFGYYTIEANNPESCQHPGMSPGCIYDPVNSAVLTCFEVFLSDEPNGNCDDAFIPIEDDCVFDQSFTKEEIIESLFDEISRIRLNSDLPPRVKKMQTRKIKNCLSKFIKISVKKLLEANEKEEAITLLSNIPNFKAQIMAYGLILESYDIERAEELLTSISTTDEGKRNFIAVQRVYLNYLNDIEYFELNEIDREMIKEVAQTNSSLAAYARAVHYLFTGERIISKIEHLDKTREDKNFPKNIQNKPNSQSVAIYPNPVNNLIKINIQQAFVSLDQFTVKIYDVHGRLLQQSAIHTGHNQIDFSKQHKGIYLIAIEKNGEIIASEKIMK